MALYQFRAAGEDGRITTGRMEALHETDLAAQLKRQKQDLIVAKEVAARSRTIKSMPSREVLGILFQLEMLVRAGVPILDSLADLRDASETQASRDLAGSLFERIEAGSTLGEAVAFFPGVFSDTVINLIRSGEVTGQLPDVLKEVVRSLKWQDEMTAQTKKLLTYPLFMMLVIGAVVFFLMVYLVPQLVGFLNNLGKEIPLQTRVLIAVSDFFVNFWWVILSVPPMVVLGTLSLSASSPKIKYQLHYMQLAMPVIGPVLKKMTMARFADTLSLMYSTGIPLIEGLVYCQKISNNLVIQGAIARARERVVTGTTLSDSFVAEQLFPAFVIRMLKVGESTGGLDKSLANISYFYSRDIDDSIGKVQSMIGPALNVVMGLILGWIMMAVLGPIYDTISTMST
jgi:type IV pilus assembly protein PilC